MPSHDRGCDRAPERAADRRPGTAPWVLNLVLGAVVLALAAGVAAIRVETDRATARARAEAFEARTRAAQEETTRLQESMDLVFHGLMEAQGISSRARSLVGLEHGIVPYGQDVHPGLPDLSLIHI